MEVSFYLKRPNEKGETVIFARISYGERLKYYLPEKIKPINWNSATHRAKESKKFPEYPEFNSRLDNIEKEIKNAIRKYQNDHSDGTIPSPFLLRELLDISIKKRTRGKSFTFFSYFEDFITRCKEGKHTHPKTGKPITQGTIKTYEVTKRCLEAYCIARKKQIDFNNIDLHLYTDLTDHLTRVQNQSLNSVGKHIKIIKTVLSDATDRGINQNLAFKSRRFITIKEETEAIYLAEHELLDLQQLDLSGRPNLERARDLFLIGCYTGLRFSDFSVLKPGQIRDGFIETKQIKTGEPVVIPVHTVVEEILNKYAGTLPAAYSNQKTNEYLKEIGSMVKCLKKKIGIPLKKHMLPGDDVYKYHFITTHTARRSFATNEYLAGTPTITIMAITGHKTEKAFLKYIRVTPSEHAKILKLSWEKRKQTNVIAI